MYTGTCFLPSWTAIVCPTNDGKIVERRDHVLITALSFAAFRASTFFSRLASAKGPFFNERDILYPPYYFAKAFPSRLLTMSLLDCLFFFLVFRPSAGLPHGVHGPGRPIPVLPSPPPCGWSLGFITEPRTVGLIPMWRLRPALPMLIRLWSPFPTVPMDARQTIGTILISPDGNLSVAYFPSFAIN